MESEKPGQRLHIIYYGRVQGVGFRQSVLRLARRHPVAGFVRNLLDGTVEMVLEGPAADLTQMQTEISQLFHRNITHADLHEESTTGEFSTFEVR